jgi:putative ABC transport system permease protein
MVDFSFQALKANKLRSFLTMLGIIIGVASVILMIAIGQGSQAQVMARVNSLGSNVMMVLPGALGRFGAGSEGTAQTLTLGQDGKIAQLPYVANVAPVVRKGALVTHGANTWTTTITGTTPSITAISSTIKTVEGRFFSQNEEKDVAPVAVPGQTAYENLYPNGSDPVDTKISINQVPFTVIGLLEPAGASMGGNNPDDMVYVPLRTAQIRLLGITNVSLIEVQATKGNQVDTVVNEVTTLLHRLHNLAPGATNDFTVRNLSQILSTAQDISGMLTLFLAGVAAISLVVGGIGIMNIMLVSVS